MAKVTNPLGSGEARGKVGDLIYNTWRGIRTVRAYTPPAHENDPKRVAHKLIVQAAAARWRDLTGAQRAAWDAFANRHMDVDWTGSPKRLAGFHWYVRINTKIKELGLGYQDNPPTWLVLPVLQGLALFPQSDWIEVAWQPNFSYSQGYLFLEIWVTKPLSAGRNPTTHDAHKLFAQEQRYGSYGFTDVPPGWYTFFVRYLHRNGQTGPWYSIRGYGPSG